MLIFRKLRDRYQMIVTEMKINRLSCQLHFVNYVASSGIDQLNCLGYHRNVHAFSDLYSFVFHIQTDFLHIFVIDDHLRKKKIPVTNKTDAQGKR